MARPTNRDQLIEASETNFGKLTAMVDAFPPDRLEAEFPFEDRDRNVRDVLAHLHEWHLMMLGWHRVGMDGQKPSIPAPGHTWWTLPDLNRDVWQKYQDVPLDDVRAKLVDSHRELQRLIESYGDAELFEKKRYAWTGSTSLGAYFISATASHYDWAMKKLRHAARELDASVKK